MSLPDRLKAARSALGLSQKQLAAQSGVAPRSYQGYEDGRSVPGGDAIAGFISAGINANWLLTGDGPMLLAELQREPELPKINAKALAAILEGAQRGLKGATTLQVAEFAVNMYADALSKGLITTDGIGKGSDREAS